MGRHVAIERLLGGDLPARTFMNLGAVVGLRHSTTTTSSSTGKVGGATAGSLIGTRTHWWGDAPPSSGSTVVPYRGHATDLW
jgi:hypothetical protein